MSNYRYYQEHGGEETWKPWPASELDKLLATKNPAFITALAVNKLADDIPAEDRALLKYSGPLYFDWDGADMAAVAEQVHRLCAMLEIKGLDMACASLYATGGRGFHLEIPMACFMNKVPRDGVQYLPVIYKQLAFDLAVEHLDFRVYSGGRGRMWRTCNVKRENGRYKVPITYQELQEITAESYVALTSQPRELPKPKKPELCVDLLVMFDTAKQAVEEKLRKRKKKGTDPNILRRQELPSLDALLEGRGVREGVGFHQLSLQLAIVAEAMGWSEQQLADKAAGLCANHESDSNRYNSEGKRRAELIRMHRYIDGNPCYDFSVGGIKSLLNHDAPDLDGIPVSREDVEENIKQAEDAPKSTAPQDLDEYDDVAGGVDLTKYGVYIHDAETGSKRRVCALSFGNVHILRSAATGQVSCYEADVMVNGKVVGRQVLELDVFGGLQAFNKFAGRHSHALQGSDSHVRGLMMRVAQKGKEEGKTYFVVNREGLDLINVPNHEDPEMREPFMVWADNKGVVLEPRIAAKGYEFSFQGYPDPRGAFRTDISDAPKLVDWIEEPGNKDLLRTVMTNFIGCQQPGFMSKLLGWYVACFYRMLFHKAYGKFPLLHVNGAAGSGKCVHPDTPVLMADGSKILAKYVMNGDHLMGPDGLRREVSGVHWGREKMYRIEQSHGMTYIVNASHIVSLKSRRTGAVLNINVEELHEIWSGSVLREEFGGWAGAAESGRPVSDLTITPLEDGEYVGWCVDGDHLFLLGDFTVTHNTEINKAMLSWFFFNQEGKMLTPGSTLFALSQHLSGSSSIPLIIDEYKPHEMPPDMHGRIKLLLRDAYNCRDVTRGGGTRDSDDYRALHTQQLAAPVVVIAEAAEEEAAVMERVVLCTMVRPPAAVAMQWSGRFHVAARHKNVLAILGQYLASSIVLDYNLEHLMKDFDPLLQEAQDRYMLSEKDLTAGLPEAELQAKQGAKERTVFNYTVVRFGLRVLRGLLKDIFENDFEAQLEELEAAVYDRMTDLLPSTQAEWVKVLNMMATMSQSVDPSSPAAIRKGFEYAFGMVRGKSVLELSARTAYHRYRTYCRSVGQKPLFPGDHAFLHGLKDSPAVISHGPGEWLQVPGGCFTFDLDELSRMGVEPFKER